MKKSLIAVAALLVLFGCDARTERTRADLSKLSYQRDARTGECYAVVGHTEGGNILFNNTNGFTITWVPCSPKVLEAVSQDSKGF